MKQKYSIKVLISTPVVTMSLMTLCVSFLSLVIITDHQGIREPRPVSAHPWYPTRTQDVLTEGPVWAPDMSYPTTRRRPVFRDTPLTTTAATSTTMTTTEPPTTRTTTTTTEASKTTRTTTRLPLKQQQQQQQNQQQPTTTEPTTTPILKSCQPFSWTEKHKEKLRSDLMTQIYKVGAEVCKVFNGTNCPYQKVINKVRECLRSYPQFVNDANVEGEDFVPRIDPVRKPPTKASTVNDPVRGFLGKLE